MRRGVFPPPIYINSLQDLEALREAPPAARGSIQPLVVLGPALAWTGIVKLPKGDPEQLQPLLYEEASRLYPDGERAGFQLDSFLLPAEPGGDETRWVVCLWPQALERGAAGQERHGKGPVFAGAATFALRCLASDGALGKPFVLGLWAQGAPVFVCRSEAGHFSMESGEVTLGTSPAGAPAFSLGMPAKPVSEQPALLRDAQRLDDRTLDVRQGHPSGAPRPSNPWVRRIRYAALVLLVLAGAANMLARYLLTLDSRIALESMRLGSLQARLVDYQRARLELEALEAEYAEIVRKAPVNLVPLLARVAELMSAGDRMTGLSYQNAERTVRIGIVSRAPFPLLESVKGLGLLENAGIGSLQARGTQGDLVFWLEGTLPQ